MSSIEHRFKATQTYKAIRMSRDCTGQTEGNVAYGGTCDYCGQFHPEAATLFGGRGALCCPDCADSMEQAEREAFTESQERR